MYIFWEINFQKTKKYNHFEDTAAIAPVVLVRQDVPHKD
jgi:hypothetical protein